MTKRKSNKKEERVIKKDVLISSQLSDQNIALYKLLYEVEKNNNKIPSKSDTNNKIK